MNHTSFERILTSREKAELRGASFRDIELSGVDLSNADLRGACFEKVVLANCNLTGADLRGAHFFLCDLRWINLADAKLGDNRFYGTTLVEVAGLSHYARAFIARDGGTFQPPRASLR